MRRAAIVSPLRTPIGKFLGSLSPASADLLASTVIRAVVSRSGIDPNRIDECIFAQGYPNGEHPCLGRWAALAAGLPIALPGLQLDRRCGGGLQAVVSAAMMIQAGAADVVLAGGAESMSNAEHYATGLRKGVRAGTVPLHDRLARARERSQPQERFGVISGMIETAENLAKAYGVTREACDAYAVQSQRRAAAAWTKARFKEEIAPVRLSGRKDKHVEIARDEGIRADTTEEKLALIEPVMEGGVSTAGNSSQQSDAAAACLVVAEDRLAALGLEPSGTLVGWAAVGCDPAMMGLGPVPAVEKLFAKTGLSWKDIGLVELNEAFAAQVLAVLKGWNWDDRERLNVNGSGISLGHPIAATGARILATLLHEMRRRHVRYGLETMCIAGGQGMAAIFERA